MLFTILTLICLCLTKTAVLAAPVNGHPIPVTPLPPLVTNGLPTVTLPIHLCPIFMCPMILPDSRFSDDSRPIRPCHCPQFPIDRAPVIV
ncbi:unnamed protein product, partial [Mesorhabditis belari]|uniref:Uncharacterized protein n=1 Tax=Mesorhabditis belari TaxID=2138241 RepID=A0AAF3E8H2_9BILA